MEKVTLYIPCYNSEKFIAACLGAVMKQSYPIDEILVIDDGSGDSTVKIASGYNVMIIRHKINRGLAAARNTALREARNELVASLDADCVPSIDWLKNMIGGLNDESVAGIGGLLHERYSETMADKWRERHMSQNRGSKLLSNPEFIYGSNAVFRKNIIFSVGLYNEKLGNNYEDVDLSNRIYEFGYQLIYNPDAIVEHLRTDTIFSVMRNYWKWQYNRVFYKEKNIIRRLALIFGSLPGLLESLVYKDLRKFNPSLLYIDFLFFLYQIILVFKIK